MRHLRRKPRRWRKPPRPRSSRSATSKRITAYNFARPSNGITNYRGYDNRHNTFSITNAALGAGWESGDALGRLVLQFGSTPSTEYLGEPQLPGTRRPTRRAPTSGSSSKRRTSGTRSPAFEVSSCKAVSSSSPVGPESIAVKDNWNWSRSNLFFGLWSYQTGVRALYD